MWFTMQGIGQVALPCRAEAEGMVPDPDEAERLVTSRTRAIVLITPNNPTGTIFSDERLRAFYRLAERRGLALIVDETYKDFRPRITSYNVCYTKLLRAGANRCLEAATG